MAAYKSVEFQIAQSEQDYEYPPQIFTSEWNDEHFAKTQPPKFGTDLKRILFPRLSPSICFLAHGSYGAAFESVLVDRQKWSEEIERNPVNFYYKILFKYLVSAIRSVSQLINSSPSNLLLVLNAEYGIQSILNSIEVNPLKSIWILFDITYEAVKNAIHHIAKKRGAIVHEIKLSVPITNESVLGDLETALMSFQNVEMACFEHITSPTAIVFPVNEMVKICRRNGVISLIDGAHAIGQVSLDLKSIDPDYYVSNCHKWLCSARGAAILCNFTVINSKM